MKTTAKVILALDVDNFKRAKALVDQLYPYIRIFKVGPQLFSSCGPRIIRYINQKGAGVFLDLKFYDIPNTVFNAVRQAGLLKVKMLTLHISGGEEMLRAAVKSVKTIPKKPLLIGVTVLTSANSKPAEVLRLARSGLSCGLDGVVCSAKEARILRRALGNKFIIVTPGIRQSGGAFDDQKRTAAPEEAIRAGSNFLVIGRPILKARDPLKTAREIIGLKTFKSC